MKIDELMAYAQDKCLDAGEEVVKFKFTNLKGEEIKCKWLDSFLGLFQIEGQEGFVMVPTWKKATHDLIEFEVIEE